MMSTSRMLSLALALAVAAVADAAPPPVSGLDVRRSATELIIAWSPAPVDGYRIYRSHALDCGDETLIGDVAAPTFTVAGGLSDPQAAIYRIRAYVGAEEGAASAPVYAYSATVPPATVSFAIPYTVNTQLRSDADLCAYLNGGSAQVASVSRFDPRNGILKTHNCASALSTFMLTAGDAYSVKVTTGGVIPVYGSGDPEWKISFTTAGMPMPSAVGSQLVSLPYDHAYADLLAVAADLPGALDVLTIDPIQGFVGVTRPTTSDPFVGTNLALDSRRAEGLVIKLAAPADWVPRHTCGNACAAPVPAIAGLQAVKSLPDVALSWTLTGVAAGGYNLYRVGAKADIPGCRSGAPLLGLPQPVAFPVLDLGAGTQVFATPQYYQVVGKCSDGSPGEL